MARRRVTTAMLGVAMTLAASARSRPRPQRIAIEQLGGELPVCPDGPVTFTVQTRRTGDASTATVDVSYGACSSSVCLRPIRHRTLTVDIPGGL